MRVSPLPFRAHRRASKPHVDDKDSLWGTIQRNSHWEFLHCLLMLIGCGLPLTPNTCTGGDNVETS